MVCARLCERAYSSSEWRWFSITTEEAALLAYTLKSVCTHLARGGRVCVWAWLDWSSMGFFFCLPGAPYFLLPVYPGRGGRKEFQKRISLCRMHKLWQHTHTNSRAYCAQQRTKKKKPFVSGPIEVPSHPYLEDTLTQTHSISFAWQ